MDMRHLREEANKVRENIREVKSDLPYRSNQPATEQDIAGVRSLQVPNPIRQKVEETPANSPTAEAQAQSNASWQDAMAASAGVNPIEKESHGTGTTGDSHKQKEAFDSNLTMEELQSMYEKKLQLIEDLQKHIEVLRHSRKTEIKTLQDGLSQMINRCREWWKKLLDRCSHLEAEFQQKLAQVNNVGSCYVLLYLCYGSDKDIQQKLRSYEQTCQDLAQKLNDKTVEYDNLRAQLEKAQTSLLKHKNKKRKLKEDVKALSKELENLKRNQEDITKQSSRPSQEEWETKKKQLELALKKAEEDTMNARKSKLECIQQTGAEINNLRDYIKILQKQLRNNFCCFFCYDLF
ncbi:hypothetical protein RFI_11413 [Reticulomyxa filosa]|uniref:Uncharacterized protein n=1 Tax=Reticulomyxa filosa TaxID=46433 RepID=X6NK42_RETFI|nr:hypothetical protein RFI_11413 [Reticulomyxa filosa]|eukprot:ETO25727.1 hypothetical protein RFI_11413 [Reticulomyxa filosa]